MLRRCAAPGIGLRALGCGGAATSPSWARTGPACTGHGGGAVRSAPFRCRSTADAVAEEMAYVLDPCRGALAVVQDQEQVDKILLRGRQKFRPLTQSDLRRATRSAGVRPAPAAAIAEVHRRGPQALRGSGARRSGGERRDRAGQGLGPRRHALHVGHDRPAEGRDARCRQCRRGRADRHANSTS